MDDLNKLNKNQIILLTLLVSFVTSIATGIVTVTLIQQAPSSVIQPVNQVILRTVEKVVEGKPQIKEVPVIVTEEQLIIKVINKATPSVVTIVGAPTSTTTEQTLSAGFVTSVAEGYVVTSGRAGFVANQTYKVVFLDGSDHKAVLVSGIDSPVAVLKLESKPAGLAAIALASENLAIGQTIVALGSTGAQADAVAVGIVSGVTKGDATTPTRIRTSAANIDNIGSPLLDVQGQVVGLSEGAGLGLSFEAIKQALDAVKK